MSHGKKNIFQCSKDHACCSDVFKMQKQIQSLQLKLRNCKQDLLLAESINMKLIKQLEEQTGRINNNYRVATRNSFEKNDTLKDSRLIEEYQGKIRLLHSEIIKITQDFNRQISFLQQKHSIQIQQYEQQKVRSALHILDLEADIKNTKQTIFKIEKQKKQLTKDTQNYRETVLNAECIQRKAEADRITMQMQLTRMKEAMNEMEKTHSMLNKQLMNQRHMRSQATLDSRSKSQQLARFDNELRELSEGKQRLKTKNEQLKGQVHCLDQYALQARQRQHVYHKKLLRAHNFGLSKTKTYSDLRSTGYHF